MIGLKLIWGVLLLAGTLLDDILAESSTSLPIQLTSSNAPKASSSTIQTSSITTAHTSSNTTHPTTHGTSNTTYTPSTTTSHAASNTTSHPTTHTTPILPTKPSPPTNGNYTVRDANRTCVIADMGLALELENPTTVIQAKESMGKLYFNVNPKETYANGTCGESKANLFLQFPEGSIHFVFVKESKIYYIDEISVNFSWNSAEHWNGTVGQLKLLQTDIGYSVKCKSTPTVKVADNLQLIMADVKLQAFDIHDNKLGKEALCSYDRNMTAVGIAVTVLILILISIIIYFICQKKRSTGYQRI